MSFSSDVKEELSLRLSGNGHCLKAELAAILMMSGQVLAKGKGEFEVYLYTENLALARKFFYLIRKAFGLVAEVVVRVNPQNKGKTYVLAVRDTKEARGILSACRFTFVSRDWDEDSAPEGMEFDPQILEKTCCRRAFLRGAFLAAGSMSDPEKSNHLEFVCLDEKSASLLQDLLPSFDIESRVVKRRKYFVVYLKEGDQIADALNVMEAHVSLMEFENIRITKEMREQVNRKVNCETANIQKAVMAAASQLSDIRFLRDSGALEELPDSLRQMALLRLEFPDATLKELGDRMDPPVGKSGVNHRLRKLKEAADRLRKVYKE